MKRYLLGIVSLAAMMYGYEDITAAQLAQKLPAVMLVDIRTAPEWKETGVVPGSRLITFFREDGSYDINNFMTQLQGQGGKGHPVAIMCRSGNRSVPVADFLSRQGYKVYNVKFGIQEWIAQHRPLKAIK